MCTGDNIDTAIAISKNANIVTQAQIDGTDPALYADFDPLPDGVEFRVVGGEHHFYDPNG